MGAFIFSMNSLLLTTVLGLSEVTTGYIMVMIAAFDIVGALIGGKLSDKYGRKKVVLLAMAVETVALIFGGIYVRNLVVIFFEVIILTCFSMFYPIIGAMVTDKTTDGKREESFSLLFHPNSPAEIRSGQELVLGIRPEAVKIVPSGGIESKVISSLPTGLDTILSLNARGTILSAIDFGIVDYKMDSIIRFTFEGNRFVLFDKESTNQITLGSLSLRA